jgi:osmoprotectant transport system permease protein
VTATAAIPPLVAGNGPDSFIWWDWIGRNTDLIWLRTIQHLQLTAIALVVGFAIATVLATVALRWRVTYAPITWVTGILYAIPSVALFAFLVPITGLSLLTAEIGLVSYTLLILVRNIVAGVDGVPAEVREAADAMGYTRAHRLVAVDLRLATPTIVAGLRIASVTIIGLVTVTALVGSGGYGVFILDGLSRNFTTPIVVGATLSIALAVAVDLALVGVQRLLTPWNHRDRAATRGTDHPSRPSPVDPRPVPAQLSGSPT